MAEISAKAVMALRDRTGCPMMDCKKALTEAGGDADQAIEILRKRGLASAAARQDRQASEGCLTIALAKDGRAGAFAELLCQTDFVARNAEFMGFTDALAAAALETGSASPDVVLKRPAPGGKGTLGERLALLTNSLREKVALGRLAVQAVPKGQSGWVSGYVHFNRKVGALVQLAWNGPGAPATPPENVGHEICLQVVSRPPTAVRREDVPADVVERERRIQSETEDLQKKPEAVRGKIVEGRISKWFQEICLLEQPWVKDDKQSIATLLAKVGGGRLSIARFDRFAVGA